MRLSICLWLLCFVMRFLTITCVINNAGGCYLPVFISHTFLSSLALIFFDFFFFYFFPLCNFSLKLRLSSVLIMVYIWRKIFWSFVFQYLNLSGSSSVSWQSVFPKALNFFLWKSHDCLSVNIAILNCLNFPYTFYVFST